VKEDHNLSAILGPTNTGKTHLAFDRLISYKSGIFGFPLRLLARENYDKAVHKLGYQNVALITGEEKIIPKMAKFFFCTVESMPLATEVECVAIDEVQLAADYERGHIFTDRILNLRGAYETLFLGSLTIAGILLKLFPRINIQKRDRFSRLSFLPKQSLSKLNPRTAIIAFNINSVYEIAETIRAHKGGAAVVLGSLSPRTRNAQVQLYEEKKVDYLIATDAIGMGLNLNINHVSFSALKKFDGRYTRNLSPSELGQIAGRAGRYLNDGTFGYLKTAGNLDPLIVQAIENHNFDHINKIYWRNSNIDFTSVNSVLNSLNQFPIKSFFIHKKNAEDETNFRNLSEDSEIIKYLNNTFMVTLLWDICRIPDFQKIFKDFYLDLLKNIFLTIVTNNGILPESWLQEKIFRLENYQGGVDELSSKAASIRTWAYIANRSLWIKDPKFWQEKTSSIEDNLSDHLHTSLTTRFVDFSARYFIDTKKRGENASIEIGEDKSIKLNGQNYGYISGFNLELKISNSESLFSLTNVKKLIRKMIEEKINDFLRAPLDSLNLGDIRSLKLSDTIKIYWGDEPVGLLIKGNNIYSPKADVLKTEFLNSNNKVLVLKKLQEWLDERISVILKPISEKIEETISSEVRAIFFNVFNSLGTLLIGEHSETIKNVVEHDKAAISRAGIRVGAKFFFMPNLLKKNSMELSAILWKVFYGSEKKNIYPLPLDGRVSFLPEVNMPSTYWASIGYHSINNFAIRVDVFERVFFIARKKTKYGPFIDSADMMNPIGCNSEQLQNILKFCGFKSLKLGDDKKLFFLKQRRSQQKIIKIAASRKKITKPAVIKIAATRKKIIKTAVLKTSASKKGAIDIKKNRSVKNISTDKIKQPIEKEITADPNSPFAVLEKLL
jgi:ATP-dependent RNA helicase SUPV3L1/SUV3